MSQVPKRSDQNAERSDQVATQSDENAGRSVQAAADWIRARCDVVPSVAIILGSGLGGIADKIESPVAIEFADIPGFGTSTAAGHRGQLILGTMQGKNIVAMAGRFHRYEGWTNDDVAFPVDVMHAIGASRLIVSNAAGGVRPGLRVGDIVVIDSHLNFMTGYFGFNRERLGCQKGSSHQPASGLTRRAGDATYDAAMARTALDVSIREGFAAYRGTYLATFGPTYETRAEYRMMRRIGADVVGMSTVPEVLAARNCGMSVLGLSMVSNVASPDVAVKADHEEVLQAGRDAEVKMESIVRGVLDSI